MIYDPYRDEMFTAIKDQGAFVNGKQMHVREDKTLHESVVGYATNYIAKIRKAMMRGVTAVGDYALRFCLIISFTLVLVLLVVLHYILLGLLLVD